MLPGGLSAIVVLALGLLSAVILIVGRSFYGIDKRTKAQQVGSDTQIKVEREAREKAEEKEDAQRALWILAEARAGKAEALYEGNQVRITALTDQVRLLNAKIADLEALVLAQIPLPPRIATPLPLPPGTGSAS